VGKVSEFSRFLDGVAAVMASIALSVVGNFGMRYSGVVLGTTLIVEDSTKIDDCLVSVGFL